MHLLAIDLNAPATYITVGPFSVSVGNLVMILASMALFVLAVVIPFPGHDKEKQ